MDFDIKKVLAEEQTAMQAIFSGQYPVVQAAITNYLLSSETRLQELANYRLSADISDKFLMERLSEEKDILMSELLSFEVIAKQTAQDAINQAQEIFIKTLSDLLVHSTAVPL